MGTSAFDGVPRLQVAVGDSLRREVATDPLDDTGDAAIAGDPGALASLAAEPGLDTEAVTMGSMASQAAGGFGGSNPPPTTGLVREYVWGPGDNGVDELLAQYGRGDPGPHDVSRERPRTEGRGLGAESQASSGAEC